MITRLLLLAAAGIALSGCGRLGDLQQPPPLFGEGARAAYQAEQAAGTADETSDRENEREDSQTAAPAPNEDLRPRDRGEFGTPAAPVNIPPAVVAPPPATPPAAAPVTPTTQPGGVTLR